MLKKQCEVCRTTLIKKQTRYCSWACRGKGNSKNLKAKGIKPPSRAGKIPWNKDKRYDAVRGKNNPNWKGGVTKLSYKIRRLFEYRQWRSDVYFRDDFTCQNCGSSKSGTLEAHHIKAMSEIISENKILTIADAISCEELWNINNGQTLCVDCHRQTDNYGRKSKSKT